MSAHKHRTTHITMERITVTRIRTRNRSQKFYCDICQKEIDVAGRLLLTGEVVEADTTEPIVTDTNQTKEKRQ
jgi:hypothetical protein